MIPKTKALMVIRNDYPKLYTNVYKNNFNGLNAQIRRFVCKTYDYWSLKSVQDPVKGAVINSLI